MRDYLSKEALSEPCWRNFVLAPVMGLFFIVFMPAIGFYLLGEWSIKKLIKAYSIPQLDKTRLMS